MSDAPVKLTGRLVGLRELQSSDAGALHAVYGDPAVCRYMSFTPRTVDQCEAIIDAALKDAEAEPRQVYMLAISGKYDELIGAARLGLGEWKSAQIGFALRTDHWGSAKAGKQSGCCSAWGSAISEAGSLRSGQAP